MANPPSPTSPAPQVKANAGAPVPPQASSPTPEKPTGTPAAAPQEPPRKLKFKADGQEIELPESEVLELASAGRAANQRFQEAAKLRREAEEIYKIAKANPQEFFQKTGMNAREWAEKFLLGELQKEAETPEQKKARENEEKLRKYEASEKEQKDKELNEERSRATAAERERLDKAFTKALFDSGLPRTKFTVKRMAELQLINIKNKFELPPERLAKLVREDYVNEQKALMGSLEGDQLLEFLGPELTKKFSKAQIAKLKARGVQPAKQTASGEQAQAPGSWRDYQKKNRGRA